MMARVNKRTSTIKQFVALEQQAQSEFFGARFSDFNGYGGAGYRLAPENRHLNLAPAIREAAPAYFAQNRIAWHRHASHGLSSQVCCLNFLMPMADKPEILALFVAEALQIDPPEMLSVETGPSGKPWFVAFEWIGRKDYLNESGSTGVRTRGANATSADAYVRFRNSGWTEGLLIEWKYTESYGPPIQPKGNAERVRRYQHLAFAPDGPVRSDLGLSLTDFFYEPFYQLLRQQMLAHYMQKEREDGAARVRVLHVSPAANAALRNVTAPALRPFGSNAFSAFRSVLRCPDDFVSVATEDVFAPLLSGSSPESAEWAAYLQERYTFLNSHALNETSGA